MESSGENICQDEFLRLVARAFVVNEADAPSANGMPFGDICFVFPNRRSMKFFQKYLGEEFGRVKSRPLFSPQMVTISELFSSISGLESVDPIEAQYILYRNYIALKYGDEPFDSATLKEPFDEFIHWSSAIISDFGDIDKYLIDASQLFNNVKDLKEIESDYSFLSDNQRAAVEMFWRSFLGGGDNFKKESFSALWKIMYPLYLNFREELRRSGRGYEGMIYRDVAEKPDACSFARVVFIGFNAPNKCEQRLMRWLKEQGRGDFYWDFYGPMVTDRENKASLFISEAVAEFPSKYRIESDSPIPQFNLIGIASGVGQAFVASDIIRELDLGNPIKTAVLLPDENLLLPLLNSLPENCSPINVTMGYPITSTPLVSFMKCISELQKDVVTSGEKSLFYHNSIRTLLRHEYIRQFADEEARRIIKSIMEENIIYLDSKDEILSRIESPLLKMIFTVAPTAEVLMDYLLDILKELDLLTTRLNKEFIFQYYKAVERVKSLQIPMKKETALRLIGQITGSLTIPFRGEPLAGVQVIGSLEVRALDFDNLIILSMNEGKFPASSQSDSLIPYNLRVGFGLPTYELKDAIAAYHFYRSIYRAKRVWMVYDTRVEGLNSGEVSRFVKQLEYHYNIQLDRQVVLSAPVVNKSGAEIKIEKDDFVMAKLRHSYTDDDATKNLSASALNAYLACPLQFYLQYVEEIREENEIEESIEAGTFGTIFHDAMEEIYSKYISEVVTAEIIDSVLANRRELERIIEAKFKKNRIREITGRNLIIKEVIMKYVTLTLLEDKKYAPFTYWAGEEKFYHKLKLSNGMRVRFKAVIDRIDSVGDELRVIDYKTGSVEKPSSHFEIPQLFERNPYKQYKAYVQLYLYALILDEIRKERGAVALKSGAKLTPELGEQTTRFNVALYPLASLKSNSILVEPVTEGNLSLYRESLVNCVEEIFNRDIPFVQAEEGSKICEYCIFKEICGR